jgi:TolB protein
VLSVYWPGQADDFAKPTAAVPVLYLFDPAGGRYQIRRFPATSNPPFVLDWSGDKTRALLSTGFGNTEQLVLATGKVSQIKLPEQAFADSFTRPTGQGVLTWQIMGNNKVQFARYDLDGRLGKVLTSDADGLGAVYNGSGTELAVTASHGIWLVSNGGGITAKLGVPGSGAGCTPGRWWDKTTVLASCQATKKSHSRLWLVPQDGSKPRPLTAQRGQHSIDLGDLDAWPLRGTTYLQGLARSGQGRIFQQPAGRPVTTVPVPHAPRDDFIFATHRSRLLILASDLRSEHTTLLWLNPATGQEQPLISTKPKLTGVRGAVPFGGRRFADFLEFVTGGGSVTRQLVRP